MSAALRARYRSWLALQSDWLEFGPDECFAPLPEGLPWWHRLRARRMYGVSL